MSIGDGSNIRIRVITRKVPLEQQEAETLAAYLRTHKIKFTHIPNETGSDQHARARAMRMKRAGVSKGFPDYLVFANNHRIAIELKRKKGSRTSPEQLEWLRELANYGFNAAVCHGANEAIEFIESITKKEVK